MGFETATETDLPLFAPRLDTIPAEPRARELTPIELARFWGNVDVGQAFECWPWKGRKNGKGYGRWRDEMAHRVSFRLVNGPITEEELARHSCDNPPCCNPAHLLKGSAWDNSNDAVQRGRTARGERHPKTILTAASVDIIRKNPEKLTGRALGLKFGVASSTISYIRNRRSWK